MFNTPLRMSRPQKTADGQGGSLVQIDYDNAITLWADPVVQEDGQKLAVRREEDVRIGDLIEVPHNLFL